MLNFFRYRHEQQVDDPNSVELYEDLEVTESDAEVHTSQAYRLGCCRKGQNGCLDQLDMSIEDKAAGHVQGQS